MAKDILAGADISFSNGDLNIGYSDQQHVGHILLAHPGHYKSAGWLGIGIGDYLKSSMSPITKQELEQKVKIHVESDGGKLRNVKIPDAQNIQIDAEYD